VRRLIPLGLLAIALSATACGALGGPGAPASSAPPPAGSTTAASSAPAASGGPTSAAPGQPTPADPSALAGNGQLGQVVASRTSAKDGDKVIAELYPVQRDGTVSHLNLTLSVPAGASKKVQVSDLLSDENYDAIDHDGLVADGIQLVDGKNAKLYLVASDGRGQCLCSRGLSGVFLGEGAPVLISATFAAPPADVTSVDVRLPSFGTVKGVPVS
jgi:hypothetical protein